MTLECEATYSGKQTKDDWKDTEPQHEPVRPAGALKSHDDQPCELLCQEQKR